MQKLRTLLASVVLLSVAGALPASAQSHAPACAHQAGVSCGRSDQTAAAANTAVIVQNGDGNTLRLQQRGLDLAANVTQTGDDNRLKLKQFGNGETANVLQTGGEHATIVQGSPGNGDPRRVGMQRHLDWRR